MLNRLTQIIYKYLLVSLILLAFTCLPAYAGDGDGSGGGQGEPLLLDSSSPANGESNVDISVQVKLEFSKNVINMSVKENNQKCFSLFDGQGNVIPITVIMADDQIEPDKKREVILVPNEKLQVNMDYKVVISGNMQSKSSVTLGTDVTITFKTGKPIEAATPTTTNQTNTTTTETDLSATDSTPTDPLTEAETDTVASSAEKAGENVWIYSGIATLIVIGAASAIVLYKKKASNNGPMRK